VADRNRFPVEVLTPEGQVFAGEVEMLATRTAVGEIGVLANHEPLLGLVEPTELRLHLGGGAIERYAQGDGYVQVRDNQALLLVEEAIRPEDLDVADLRRRAVEAEERIDAAERGTAEWQRAGRDKRRAEAFLRVAGEE
jgi:F-type H+-transporting ATPase subunit epsilon